MALLFTDYFTKTYKASFLSKSTVIFFIFMALALIMPIILVVKTHSKYFVVIDNIDFWVRNLTFTEQPKVQHLNEIIVLYHTTNGVFQASMNKRLSDSSEAEISPQFNVKQLITICIDFERGLQS